MTFITVNDETARLIGEAAAPVVLVDSKGQHVGRVTKVNILPPDASEAEIIAEVKRRMAEDDGTRIPHAEVMAHLRALAPERCDSP
jgi:hypothetical protein